MRALILVDLQNDFMPGGALAVKDGNQTVAVANKLIPHFDLVVATQDWHPLNHRSFVTENPGHNVYDLVDLEGLQQVVWPVHCVQGSHGAELHKDLTAEKIAEIVYKGNDRNIDSYSGFFDNGKRKATDLEKFLKSKGVTEVYVMGLATDYCVKFTALDAVALGFDTTLIEDGCRAVNLAPDDGVKAIEEMKAAGIKVTTSNTLV